MTTVTKENILLSFSSMFLYLSPCTSQYLAHTSPYVFLIKHIHNK